MNAKIEIKTRGLAREKLCRAILVALLFASTSCMGQIDPWLQRIRQSWQNAHHDTMRILTMAEFANYYKFHRPDSAIVYSSMALNLANAIDFTRGQITARRYLAIAYDEIGDYSSAIKVSLEGYDLAEKNGILFDQALFKAVEGYIYIQTQNNSQALKVLRQGLLVADNIGVQKGHDLPLANILRTRIGQAYLASNEIDSANHYIDWALESASRNMDYPFPYIRALIVMGDIAAHQNKALEAISFYRQTLVIKDIEPRQRAETLLAIARQYEAIELRDSSIEIGLRSLAASAAIKHYKSIENASLFLSNVLQHSDKDEALNYMRLAHIAQDSLNNRLSTKALQAIREFEQDRQAAEIAAVRVKSKTDLRMRTMLGALFILCLFSYFIYRSYKRKQRTNLELERAYSKLKSTQTQLIHTEKMASLGELTAGIAHEIQNPLNFVNNFSEVSNELLEEAEEELAGGNYDEVVDIVSDLKENLSKINHHGGRASSIVQGMLAHSRSGSGEKELTDINALCDEYMRLAYHGMRAKDKNFNSDFELDLDPNLPKVKVVPQDIGRVLLNLLNNAFYACAERSRSTVNKKKHRLSNSKFQAADYNYTPSVKMGTKFIAAGNSEKEMVRISVTDNGEGMSPETVEKVFQPFFTTKPTGEGTGLGLSLSYDIVTKGHGGTIEVESPPAGQAGEEGIGTTFVITLPLA